MGRLRLDERRASALALGGALALLLTLATVDLSTDIQLAGSYSAAAVVASTSADPRRTALVGALAAAATIASWTWFGDPDGLEWALRLAGCVLVVVAAVGAAAVGDRHRRRWQHTVEAEERLLAALAADLTGARTRSAVATAFVSHVAATIGVATARVYTLDGDVLRSLAWHRGDGTLAQAYDEIPLDSDLPGAVAVREDRPLHLGSLAQIHRAMPALRGYYTEELSLHVLPLRDPAGQRGLLALTFTAAGRPQGAMFRLLESLAAALARALQRGAQMEAEDAATQRLQLLAEASMTLARSLDYRSTLDEVCRLLVPRFADWCSVQLLREGRLQTLAIAHRDPARAAWAQEMVASYPTRVDAPTGAAAVVRTGTSELYPFLPPETLAAAATDAEHLRILEELGMTSALVAPLRGRSGVLGAVTLIHAESGRRYSAEDVAFLEDVAGRAGLALETAVTFREQSERLADVTRVADAAQRAILAPPPPTVGPLALAARYVSAAAEAQVGGDLYEVVTGPDVTRLLVGDVRGKGLAAVRTATIVLGEFRAVATEVRELAEVARLIDRRLRAYLSEEDFVTAALVDVRSDGGFTVVSCGHPAPVVVPAGGQARELALEHAPPLGLGADPVPAHGQLEIGDRILLFTDGLVETRDERGGFVPLGELLPALAAPDLDTALDELLDCLRDRAGGPLDDDLALLLAERRT